MKCPADEIRILSVLAFAAAFVKNLISLATEGVPLNPPTSKLTIELAVLEVISEREAPSPSKVVMPIV